MQAICRWVSVGVGWGHAANDFNQDMQLGVLLTLINRTAVSFSPIIHIAAQGRQSNAGAQGCLVLTKYPPPGPPSSTSTPAASLAGSSLTYTALPFPPISPGSISDAPHAAQGGAEPASLGADVPSAAAASSVGALGGQQWRLLRRGAGP